MELLNDRRTVLALAGAAVALLAGVAFAWVLVVQHRGERVPPPAASRAGLVIDSSDVPDGHMNSTRPLRCFVAGQFVGELTLAECAKRNGVATDALDVGLDRTGALAAADQAGAMITPLPPTEAKSEEAGAAPDTTSPAAAPTIVSGPLGACWRYSEGQWRKLPNDLALLACVQTLFAGRCERAGEAVYGRWAQQTLRLVAGHVELSSDNRTFRSLMDQQGCPAPPAG